MRYIRGSKYIFKGYVVTYLYEYGLSTKYDHLVEISISDIKRLRRLGWYFHSNTTRGTYLILVNKLDLIALTPLSEAIYI